MDEKTLLIYTDGSSYQSPRRGGIGCKFKFPIDCDTEEKKYSPRGYYSATNNQAELAACIFSLQKVKRFLKEKKKCFYKVIIYSDSQYIVNNYSKAIWEWTKRKWRKLDGSPVSNQKLWKEFKTLFISISNLGIRIEIRKVKGHSEDQDNKDVDKLAKKSAKRATKLNVLIPTRARRKESPNSVEIGSVKINGQKMFIKIIDSLEVNDGEHKYKYEVIDKKSKYNQCVDIIFSKKSLKLGKIILVKVNRNQGYPQIMEVIKNDI